MQWRNVPKLLFDGLTIIDADFMLNCIHATKLVSIQCKDVMEGQDKHSCSSHISWGSVTEAIQVQLFKELLLLCSYCHRAFISCPSTLRLMRVSGPSQCAVVPSAKIEEAWHMVATCAITPVEGLLGWVPSFVDPPPWSLNAPYAKHRRSHNENNLL